MIGSPCPGEALPGPDIGSLVARCADIGVLDQVTPLLAELGWDGTFDASRRPDRDVHGHQHSFGDAERHARGIHYTPPRVAAGLVEVALADVAPAARIGDPACGTGVFLVASAEHLRRHGATVESVIDDQIFGMDIDPVAVALARLELALWAARHTGSCREVPTGHLGVGDGLVDADRLVCRGPLDAVVGNPPFGSQLKGDTVRSRSERRRLEGVFGRGALGSADTAALFLERSVGLVGDGGVVCLVLPASLAAASGAARVRDAVSVRGRPEAVWLGGTDVGFDASVEVWAPVLGVGRPTPGPIARYRGATVDPLDVIGRPTEGGNWAPLLVDVPTARHAPAPGGTGPRGAALSQIATVTAGFRRHFYGLAPHVVDDPGHQTPWPVLVTTGAIDPFRHRVDEPVRFARRNWRRPVVDLASLGAADRDLAEWVRTVLEPKVLVAAQGRVVEVVVDVEGVMVPSTPTVAVVPRPDAPTTLWHIAAVLSSPEATRRLHLEAGGTGLAAGVCRVSTGFVAATTMPADLSTWDRAASAARRATEAAQRCDAATWEAELDRMARVAPPGDADSVEALQRWWRERRPPWRSARTLGR